MVKSEFKPKTVMYWTRVIIGAALGALHALFWRPPSSLISSILIVLAVYVFTYRLFKMAYKGKLKDEGAIWKEGAGSFFLAWLFTWFLLYNMLFPLE